MFIYLISSFHAEGFFFLINYGKKKSPVHFARRFTNYTDIYFFKGINAFDNIFLLFIQQFLILSTLSYKRY